jgi:serine/threonine-protein kinase HipA
LVSSSWFWILTLKAIRINRLRYWFPFEAGGNGKSGIKHYCRENASESLARLYEYIMFCVMTGNGDAHLKNFGVLYSHPAAEAPRLAPLFDVVTTTVYDYKNQQTGQLMTDRTLALSLNKSKAYPSRETLMNFGATHCLVKNPAEALEPP